MTEFTVRHCVMFKLKDGQGDHPYIDDAAKEKMLTAGKELPALIGPDLKGPMSFTGGFDLGLSVGALSACFTVDFICREDYLVYAEHKAHVNFVSEYIKPFISERKAVQFAL